jgi:hypothetical protein
MSSAARLAGLSADIDSVSVHLRGYGVEDAPEEGAHYRVAVPRMLELLGAAGARATFFLIADEAERHPDLVRAIVAGGHEVGCHSATHRLPFDVAEPERAQREVVEARRRLEQLAGAPVVGFRAPSWGATGTLHARLREAGFRYDASSFPSWMLFLLRWSVARRSAGPKEPLGASLREALLDRAVPHRLDGEPPLAELPLCTAPLLRLPYYHTLRYLLPAPAFGLLGAAARLRRTPCYIFHAVDFLAVEADRLDPRIARHPGMDRPLETKLELARRSVAELGRGHRVVPLRELADALLA